VLDGGPVQSPEDLRGQKISFGEIGSTSQHLGPVDLLAKAGLGYATDYEPVFLNRNVAVEALIKGEIAGVGLNRTHIESITEKFPDQKFKVLLKGEQLPNDILLASPKVTPEVIDTVRETFADHGEAILAAVIQTEANAKFVGGSFNPTVSDSDYDGVRKMFENIGITEFTEFIGE
jgi:phosphonate transport system substrate-binding protein